MPSADAKPRYIPYNAYNRVVSVYKEHANLYDESEEFEKIIKNISTEQKKLELPNKIFKTLHEILRNSKGFEWDINDNYCSYVNYRLNDDVRKNYQLVDESKFEIFNKFSSIFHDERYGVRSRKDYACKKYIKYLNNDEHRRMTILYNFYTFYDKLRSSNNLKSNPECINLPYNNKLYNEVIDDFYNHDPELYNKIKDVKVLIEEFLLKTKSKCTESVHFRIPQKILDDQKKKQQEEENRLRQEEENRRRQEEENRRRQEEENRRRQEEDNIRRQEQLQKELEFQRRRQPMHTNTDARRGIFQQGEEPFLVGQENSREEVDLGAQQPYEDQLNTRVFKSKNEDTNTDGSLLKSLRLPSAITEVLGSVDPVPVVGVSGGMGALFLLFRYTPVGTFFRGGRGRAHRIPRSFNGQFLGGFPGYDDYEVGHIGYGPMNPLAE
ncbi:VIR protein [Plasmodium vivax]|uniref:VIR protein n=1 Tax=Plasmodium vivax TaxID=5855 RepID=A0A1G4EBZ7_PLAVI|nr:VIR protein [Plasmodium vivax]